MLTKKGLILVFMFSFLTHMGVAGTLIYLPFQPYINNTTKNRERIIWTLVQSQVAPSPVGEYLNKQAADRVRSADPTLVIRVAGSRNRPHSYPPPLWGRVREGGGVRSKILEVGTNSIIHKNSGDNHLVIESTPVVVAETLYPGKWALRPVEDTKNHMLATGDDYANNTQISEVRSKNVDCNDSHCGEGGTYASHSAIDRIVIEVGRGGESKDSLKGFLEDVRREIERHKYYPSFARINGIEGTVYISFHIGGDDKPGDISINKSSGFKILDESAIRTLKSINQLSSVPEEIRELNITVPIAYRLVEEGKRKEFSEKKHMTGK